MRLAFIDTTGWDFNVETPHHRPLGGSHSAACYLTEALAAQGHTVFLVSATTQEGKIRGVDCLSTHHFRPEQLPQLNLDVAVVLLGAAPGVKMRQALGPGPLLVLWTQHAADQTALERLRDPIRVQMFDGFAIVSDWQKQGMIEEFKLPPERLCVLRNGVGPAFARLFDAGEAIVPVKAQPPVLAYTSTPFRGLDVLLRVFPAIRKIVPDATLKVFSDMKTYCMPGDQDQQENGSLYDQARQTEGVEYIGSVSQPVLAAEMRKVVVLAYPNTFAETSCIAVMEAMAAGCRVVTSDLGALPETTAGFARLIPTKLSQEEYEKRFVREAVHAIGQMKHPEAEKFLRRQVEHVRAQCDWSAKAREWEKWIGELKGLPRPNFSVAAESFIPTETLPKNMEPMDPYFGQFMGLLRRSLSAGGSEFGLGLTLFSLAATIRAGNILEIGRFKGFSTLALASALRLQEVGWDEPVQHKQRGNVNYTTFEAPRERKLYSVDPHPTTEADALIREAGLTQYVEKIDRSSDQVQIDGMVDLIFIDGDHSYEGCLGDVMRFVPKNLRAGGYFVLHDFYMAFEDAGVRHTPIRDVVDKLVRSGQLESILMDTGYQSFVIFRKPMATLSIHP